MSFRDELRRHTKLKENLQQEKTVEEEKRCTIEEKKRAAKLENAKKEAVQVLHQLYDVLFESANQGKYLSDSTRRTVSGTLAINQKYLLIFKEDNAAQYVANNNSLLRNPFVKFRCWTNYMVHYQYKEEFEMFAKTLEELAAKDGIRIEFVVKSQQSDKIFPFPSRIEWEERSEQCQVVIKCSCTYVIDPESQAAKIEEYNTLSGNEVLNQSVKEPSALKLRLEKIKTFFRKLCLYFWGENVKRSITILLLLFLLIPLIVQFTLVSAWKADVKKYVTQLTETNIAEQSADLNSDFHRAGVKRTFEIMKVEFYKSNHTFYIVPQVTYYSNLSDVWSVTASLATRDLCNEYFNHSLDIPFYIDFDYEYIWVMSNSRLVQSTGEVIVMNHYDEFKESHDDIKKVNVYLPIGFVIFYFVYLCICLAWHRRYRLVDEDKS